MVGIDILPGWPPGLLGDVLFLLLDYIFLILRPLQSFWPFLEVVGTEAKYAMYAVYEQMPLFGQKTEWLVRIMSQIMYIGLGNLWSYNPWLVIALLFIVMHSIHMTAALVYIIGFLIPGLRPVLLYVRDQASKFILLCIFGAAIFHYYEISGWLVFGFTLRIVPAFLTNPILLFIYLFPKVVYIYTVVANRFKILIWIEDHVNQAMYRVGIMRRFDFADAIILRNQRENRAKQIFKATWDFLKKYQFIWLLPFLSWAVHQLIDYLKQLTLKGKEDKDEEGIFDPIANEEKLKEKELEQRELKVQVTEARNWINGFVAIMTPIIAFAFGLNLLKTSSYLKYISTTINDSVIFSHEIQKWWKSSNTAEEVVIDTLQRVEQEYDESFEKENIDMNQGRTFMTGDSVQNLVLKIKEVFKWPETFKRKYPEPLYHIRDLYVTRKSLTQDITNFCKGNVAGIYRIVAATGVGKSTFIPYEIHKQTGKMVYVVGPRVATCKESYVFMKQRYPDLQVGYRAGGETEGSDKGIMYWTYGAFLRRYLYDDRFKNRDFILYIDEAHENSADIYALKMLNKTSLGQRAIFYTSATFLDTQASRSDTRFHIEEAIRTEITVANLKNKEYNSNWCFHTKNLDYHSLIVVPSKNNCYDIVDNIQKQMKGMVHCEALTSDNIKQNIKKLRERMEQNLALIDQPGFNAKYIIVVATNCIETGITLPFHTVYDTVEEMKPMYDFDNGTCIMTNRIISENQCLQRRGRVGRTMPGKYFAACMGHDQPSALDESEELQLFLWSHIFSFDMGVSWLYKYFPLVENFKSKALLMLDSKISTPLLYYILDDDGSVFKNFWKHRDLLQIEKKNLHESANWIPHAAVNEWKTFDFEDSFGNNIKMDLPFYDERVDTVLYIQLFDLAGLYEKKTRHLDLTTGGHDIIINTKKIYRCSDSYKEPTKDLVLNDNFTKINRYPHRQLPINMLSEEKEPEMVYGAKPKRHVMLETVRENDEIFDVGEINTNITSNSNGEGSSHTISSSDNPNVMATMMQNVKRKSVMFENTFNHSLNEDDPLSNIRHETPVYNKVTTNNYANIDKDIKMVLDIDKGAGTAVEKFVKYHLNMKSIFELKANEYDVIIEPKDKQFSKYFEKMVVPLGSREISKDNIQQILEWNVVQPTLIDYEREFLQTMANTFKIICFLNHSNYFVPLCTADHIVRLREIYFILVASSGLHENLVANLLRLVEEIKSATLFGSYSDTRLMNRKKTKAILDDIDLAYKSYKVILSRLFSEATNVYTSICVYNKIDTTANNILFRKKYKQSTEITEDTVHVDVKADGNDKSTIMEKIKKQVKAVDAKVRFTSHPIKHSHAFQFIGLSIVVIYCIYRLYQYFNRDMKDCKIEEKKKGKTKKGRGVLSDINRRKSKTHYEYYDKIDKDFTDFEIEHLITRKRGWARGHDAMLREISKMDLQADMSGSNAYDWSDDQNLIIRFRGRDGRKYTVKSNGNFEQIDLSKYDESAMVGTIVNDDAEVVGKHLGILLGTKDGELRPLNNALIVGRAVLTVRHSIHNSDELVIKHDSGTHSIEFKGVDGTQDVAIADRPPSLIQCVGKKLSIRPPRSGERVRLYTRWNRGQVSNAVNVSIDSVIYPDNQNKDGSWYYDCSSYAGDCGGAVVAVSDGNVVGIHSHGGRHHNYFQPFTDTLIALIKTMDAKTFKTHELLVPRTNFSTKEINDKISKLTDGKVEYKVMQNAFSRFEGFIKEPFFTKVGKIERHTPLGSKIVVDPYFQSYLKQFKDTLPIWMQTIEYGVAVQDFKAALKDFLKYGKVCSNRGFEKIEEAESLLIQMLEPFIEHHDKATPLEIISDVNLDSAAGAVYQGNKRDLLEESFEDLDEIVEFVQKCGDYMNIDPTLYVPSIWQNSLKDEIRHMDKIIQGKTRTFTAAPMEYVFGAKMYVDKFNHQFYAAHLDIPSTVGINKFNSGWESLFSKLNKDGWIKGGGDGSQYDSSLQPVIWKSIFNIRNHFLDYKYPNALQNIYGEVIYTLICMQDGTIYKKYTGNNSGQVSTVVDNSLALMLLMIMCYLENVPAELHNIVDLQKTFAFVVNGDDNLYAIHKNIRNYLNPDSMEKFFKAVKVIYTFEDESDDLKDIEYMSHRFKSAQFVSGANRIGPLLPRQRSLATLWFAKSLNHHDRLGAYYAAVMNSYLDYEFYIEVVKYIKWFIKQYNEVNKGLPEWDGLIRSFPDDIFLQELYFGFENKGADLKIKTPLINVIQHAQSTDIVSDSSTHMSDIDVKIPQASNPTNNNQGNIINNSNNIGSSSVSKDDLLYNTGIQISQKQGIEIIKGGEGSLEYIEHKYTRPSELTREIKHRLSQGTSSFGGILSHERPTAQGENQIMSQEAQAGDITLDENIDLGDYVPTPPNQMSEANRKKVDAGIVELFGCTTDAIKKKTLMQVLVWLAHYGTSTSTPATVTIQANNKTVNYGSLISIAEPYGGLRKWARCHADVIRKYALRTSDTKQVTIWRWGQMNGVSRDRGYIGFDFADGCKDLTPEEQAELGEAKAKAVRHNPGVDTTMKPEGASIRPGVTSSLNRARAEGGSSTADNTSPFRIRT